MIAGAGMAGLLAARVLAEHYKRVTILDRDRMPDNPGFRSGVPQSPHTHVLLGRGAALLEALFPNIRSEFLKAGAVPLDWPGDALWLTAAGWSRRFRPGISLISLSRDLIEWTVRQRVLDDPRIEMRTSTEATGLLADPDGTRVTGILVRQRGRPGSDHTIGADLIVDATGRRSQCCRWLTTLGYPAPEETSIACDVGYASRFYARPPQERDWRLLLLQAQPPDHTRSGMIACVEGDRWIVSLVGRLGDRPPTDDEGFLQFAATLRSPLLHQALRGADPVSPVRGFGISHSYRRRFDRMSGRPAGFVVIGDAVCTLNPVYAQGMTVAAIGALGLDAELRRSPSSDLTGRLQARIVRASADAWVLAGGEDLRYLALHSGERPPLRNRIMRPYLDRVVRTATHDRHVNRALLRVVNMERSPYSLLNPGVMLHAMQPGKAAPPEAPPLAQ
ncbi:2-polyprenyl-6-methoxyphenol hydroxylase-like oxidoreductase [Actinomadura sp. KC216]|uniref:NAD(P)/FAD-dependent oxidoreductase n=1 Tax=Actinomadura sp. KC216 TaxID=2530370 RepID=UPI00104C5AC2|nr:FAD-dependent monooxygenase [Actinomadura sp. KC216]TDB90614.1 2-polyprenyl-6-methoxyphenol hydroxylase-like oxidoreductase [Actinomadura sp. KC216]